MSEHDEVLAGAQVAAAEAIDIPGPAPEPEALDTELPEGEDTFDRPYVEKLRAEAHRTSHVQGRLRGVHPGGDGPLP